MSSLTLLKLQAKVTIHGIILIIIIVVVIIALRDTIRHMSPDC